MATPATVTGGEKCEIAGSDLVSGNHSLEVQVVSNERIFDSATAAALGMTGHEQIVVMVHCGSRGFGPQVASDYLKVFEISMPVMALP